MARPIKKTHKKSKSHDEKQGSKTFKYILCLGAPYLIIMAAACLIKYFGGMSFINKTALPEACRISPIILFIIKLLLQYFTVGYVVSIFKDYFEKRKNNNILGDNIFAWESESFIDKHHLREKILRGSRLKIKRDAKKHEIKYYWCAYILFLLYPVIADITNISLYAVYFLLYFTLTVIFIFNKIEGRRFVTKNAIITISVLLILKAFTLLLQIISRGSNTGIFEAYALKPASEYTIAMFPKNLIIPLAVIVVLFIYSLFRKRWMTAFITGCMTVHFAIVFMLLTAPDFEHYLSVYVCGYLYILLLIIQTIYNRKALKKITFIN